MEKYWSEDCIFPKFQLFFRREVKDPPTWFIEMLITAFIHDYDKVMDFQDLMKRWKSEKTVQFRDEMSALLSKNEEAFPYLCMGLNSLYSNSDSVSEISNLLDVGQACGEDFRSQKINSDGQNLTVGEFVSMKVDMTAMLKETYSRCLHALSLFRKERRNEYDAVTGEKVHEFLNAVFRNSANPAVQLEQAVKEFFDAIAKYEIGDLIPPEVRAQSSSSTAPQRSKNQAKIKENFFQNVFNAIRNLSGFQNYLLQFKNFVHDIETFIEFAKESKSSLLEKDSIKEHREENM